MSIRIGIITVSDRSARGERPDESGPALQNVASKQGWNVLRTAILPDEISLLSATLANWADSGEMDLILTTGGTGFSPRDITPEATIAAVQRLAPGIAEALRMASIQITPHAMLSRAVAGIRQHTLIVNLPGSPKGAVENLTVLLPVLPHAVQLLREDPSAEAGHQAT
jgi:molybdopterin adenylyltransferase